MYQAVSFDGADLPAKTLCLTFDDGPGENTVEIANFLFKHSIQATFFVVGKYAYHHPEILLQLKAMNHLIGNHTYDHPDMPYYVSVGGDVLDQVLRTDALIKPYINSSRVYFRAPYGKWSVEVANALNQNILTANHIGPIYWDVAGVDCYYWQNDWPVQDAVKRYLTDIERCGKGIIVMHDDIADMDSVKPRNKTLELVQILIPQLLGLGYQFVRLDEIRSIKTASLTNPVFTLQTKNGKYISLKDEFELWADGNPKNTNNLMQLKDLGFGKVAIKAANNLYYSTLNNTIEVVANSNEIGTTEMFDLVPVNENGLMLRCNDGRFFSIKNKKLCHDAVYMRQAAVFKYADQSLLIYSTLSWKQNLLLFRKKISFVKSKLQQKLNS